jgi:hypothetical protein
MTTVYLTIWRFSWNDKSLSDHLEILMKWQQFIWPFGDSHEMTSELWYLHHGHIYIYIHFIEKNTSQLSYSVLLTLSGIFYFKCHSTIYKFQWNIIYKNTMTTIIDTQHSLIDWINNLISTSTSVLMYNVKIYRVLSTSTIFH